MTAAWFWTSYGLQPETAERSSDVLTCQVSERYKPRTSSSIKKTRHGCWKKTQQKKPTTIFQNKQQLIKYEIALITLMPCLQCSLLVEKQIYGIRSYSPLPLFPLTCHTSSKVHNNVTSTLARQSVNQMDQITSLGPPGVPTVVAVLFRQLEVGNCRVLDERFL